MLAGSFNNWVPDQLAMQKTDSGWIFDVTLGAGKWWYKFIVDGNWIVDRDNLLAENDGQGNVNSVFFRPNKTFVLPGYTTANKVFLAGSFNAWKPDGLPMNKTPWGWELPLYIAEGTHTYKYVVDGKWMPEPDNPETVPDGTGGWNTVLRHGKPYLFQLKGYTDAKEVMLLGSFNQWRNFEWPMQKTATGWQLPFTLGPGNHEYKFRVDGQLIPDPSNPVTSSETGSSYLILHPNYTFRLHGFEQAKQVYLAGEFNRWNPAVFAMEKKGDAWIFPVHLSVGKHLYKFIVDGKWIIDPENKLWEQNEYGTGNSVLWIEK
jgi:1,4-alpha-glucan branching enzyme